MSEHRLQDNQALLTIGSPDPDWILDTLPVSWECELLTNLNALDSPEAFDTYTPRILNPIRQVFGANIRGVQVSVSGALDTVEAIRRVFCTQGTINHHRCRSGYVFLVTIRDLDLVETRRTSRIHDAIARAQSPQVPGQLGLFSA